MNFRWLYESASSKPYQSESNSHLCVAPLQPMSSRNSSLPWPFPVGAQEIPAPLVSPVAEPTLLAPVRSRQMGHAAGRCNFGGRG